MQTAQRYTHPSLMSSRTTVWFHRTHPHSNKNRSNSGSSSYKFKM